MTIKEALLASAARYEPVNAGGVTVYVRPLTIAEAVALQHAVATAPEADRDSTATAMLVSLCTVDADGVPVFGPDDADAIYGLPLSVVEPIAEAAARINRFDQRAKETAKNDLAQSLSSSWNCDSAK